MENKNEKKRKPQLRLVTFDNETRSTGKHILIVESLESRRAVALNRTVFSIGRHPHNALVINHKMVSRHHATIAWLKYTEEGNDNSDYCYWVIDGKGKRQRSRNGIYINGEKKVLHKLNSGDVIGIGEDISLRYSYMPYTRENQDFLKYCEGRKSTYQSMTDKSYKDTIFDPQ